MKIPRQFHWRVNQIPEAPRPSGTPEIPGCPILSAFFAARAALSEVEGVGDFAKPPPLPPPPPHHPPPPQTPQTPPPLLIPRPLPPAPRIQMQRLQPLHHPLKRQGWRF